VDVKRAVDLVAPRSVRGRVRRGFRGEREIIARPLFRRLMRHGWGRFLVTVAINRRVVGLLLALALNATPGRAALRWRRVR
jgi:hypothetical protein